MSFLALDQQQALAGEHEEVLRVLLAVVHAGGLAGSQHADVEAEGREARVSPLETRVGAELAVEPFRLARVEDEPALVGGLEAALGPFQVRLRDHDRHYGCHR